MQFSKLLLFILTVGMVFSPLIAIDEPGTQVENAAVQSSPAAAAAIVSSTDQNSFGSPSSSSSSYQSPDLVVSSEQVQYGQRHDIDLYVNKENPNSISASVYYDMTMTPSLVNVLIEAFPPDLKRVINRIKNKEKYVTRKIIFVGPPGCGKSDGAKAIAIYCNMDYTLIHANELGTSFSNSGVENTARLFRYARFLGRPFLIIIDELQDMFLQDNNKISFYQSVSNIKTHLEEASKNKNIVIAFTANKLVGIPEAMKSRLSQGITITIPLPDFEQRKKILKYYYSSTKNNLKDSDYDYLSRKANSLSARDIVDSVDIAHKLAATRLEKNRQDPLNPPLTCDDIVDALWIKYKESWVDTWEDCKCTIIDWAPSVGRYALYTGGAFFVAWFFYNKQEQLSLFIQKITTENMEKLAVSNQKATEALADRSLKSTEALADRAQKSAEEALSVSKDTLEIAKNGPGALGVAKNIGTSVVVGATTGITTAVIIAKGPAIIAAVKAAIGVVLSM